MIEGILIKGPLDEADIKDFGETMRRAEQKNPKEVFMMTVLGELASNVDATALLNTVFPAVEGVPYDVKTFKRTDKGHEEIAQEANLGATGKYPHGKTGSEDQGELKSAVYIRDNRLVVNFGKSLSWLSMTKQEAMMFAAGLVRKIEEMR